MPTIKERMPDAISKDTPIKLTLVAMVGLLWFAWKASERMTTYTINQEKAMVAVQKAQDEQQRKMDSISDRLQAIQQHEARMVQLQAQITANAAAVDMLRVQLDERGRTRWNAEMMEIFADQLQAQLVNGIPIAEIKIPDVRTIRADVLFGDN